MITIIICTLSLRVCLWMWHNSAIKLIHGWWSLSHSLMDETDSRMNEFVTLTINGYFLPSYHVYSTTCHYCKNILNCYCCKLYSPKSDENHPHKNLHEHRIFFDNGSCVRKLVAVESVHEVFIEQRTVFAFFRRRIKQRSTNWHNCQVKNIMSLSCYSAHM